MYLLNITPQTSPRPRFSKFGTYMPASYKKYKQDVMFLMKQCKIPEGDYSSLVFIAYFPYPKSTPKSELIECALMRVKPDIDNVTKSILDCLQEIGILKNDSQIGCISATKYYTLKKTGYIKFILT